MIREHAVDRHGDVDQRRRWLRLIGILDAAQWSGLTPVGTPALHTIAYLADVLSPVWCLEPMDGKVLKHSATPYYPSLQQDLDCLIGMGVVKVDKLFTKKSKIGKPRLEGLFSLNSEFAIPILAALRDLPDESDVLNFLSEVVQAYSRLSDDEMPKAMAEDATYGDPNIDAGDVIDLGEWGKSSSTASARATRRINAASTRDLMPSETIEIYVNHIIKRVTDAN